MEFLASVVRDHHVAVGERDLLLSFISSPRGLREEEEVQGGGDGQREVLEAPAARKRDLDGDPTAHLNPPIVGTVEVTDDPSGGGQAELRLGVELQVGSLERLIHVHPVGRDLRNIDDEHTSWAQQTLHFTPFRCEVKGLGRRARVGEPRPPRLHR